MKTIENKKFSIGEVQHSYAELIKNRLQATPREGFGDLSEMKKRLKVLDVLEKADAEIVLEDADFEVVKKIVAPTYMPYGACTQDVVEFIEAFA